MESPGTHKLQVKAVAQISWAVKDIDTVIEAWSRLYGIGPWTFGKHSGIGAKGRPWKIRLAWAYIGPVQIELVQPVEGRIVHSRFLDTWGEGLHHIGFHVDDVDGEVANLVAQGAKLIMHEPGRVAYLDAGGPGGAIFELEKRGEEERLIVSQPTDL